MAYSSKRKQALVGWFYNNAEFAPSNVQLHKFLFFYECFSKIDGDDYELEGLKGYRNGPVFGSVYADNTYGDNFKTSCRGAFPMLSHMVNNSRAKLSRFLVAILGNKLSEFTHMMNIWAVKQAEIERGCRHIPLNEDDLSEHDTAVLRDIERAYPKTYIDSVDVETIDGKAFIYFKADANRLTEEVYETLYEVASDPDFDSPIYITFNETGELLLD